MPDGELWGTVVVADQGLSPWEDSAPLATLAASDTDVATGPTVIFERASA
jgi:hypothetical protein